MKRQKLVTIALALLFACTGVCAQTTPSSWKEVPMRKTKGNASDGCPSHRFPQRVIWPEVYYDQATPSLHVCASGHSIAADYYIRNGEGELETDGILTLESSSFARIDLSGLPRDTYVLVFVLGGVAFEAEITTE